MSSDTYRVRVVAVEGREVVLEVQPTTAGGLCDLARSRSFVLMQLRRHGGPVTFEQTLDVEWLKQHLDEYVTDVRMEKLRGLTSESTLRDIARQFQIPIDHLQPRFTLRATMASEALAAFFPVGHHDGTTSYDVWMDPKAAAIAPPEDAPPFDPRPEVAEELKQALARMPRWRPSVLGIEREGEDARLHVTLDPSSFTLRPGVTARASLHVPEFLKLGGKKTGETPSILLMVADVQPPLAPYWFREYAHEPPEIAYFARETVLEEPSSLAERFTRTLDGPHVDALLSRDGIIATFEDVLAARPKKELPPSYARLGGGAAPALPGRWRWSWDTKLLWQRVVLHAALGEREDARAALEQARAKSKKPPKELKILMAALDA